LPYVGNDIVDLTDPGARKKSQNIRFVNRVFILDEQRQIFDSSNPDIILWALWAGKETAYKIISKSIPGVPFIPLFYKVSLCHIGGFKEMFPVENGHVSGIVCAPGGKVNIRIFVTCDYVHCIGTMDFSEGIDSLIWRVDLLPQRGVMPGYESIFLCEAIKKHLSMFLNRAPEEIEIWRSEGGLCPPFVYLKDKPAGVDISLSHDGKFTAYAFIISGARSQNSGARMKRKPAKDFQDLIVWQKAHQFVLSTYRLSDLFPQNEMYGLTSQIRRAAISIPANIAEGFKKKTNLDKTRYMDIAQASLEECRYYLILVKDLGYGDTLQLMSQLEEVSKLLQAYTASILNSGS